MPRDLISSKKGKRVSKKSDSSEVESENEDYALGVSDEEVEKAQERLKEAKKYLSDLTRDAKRAKTQEDGEEGEEGDLPFGEIDAEEIDREIIASRLQRDTLVSRGRAFENIAESYKERAFTKFHCNTPEGRVATGCAFSPVDKIVYLITKGNCVYQYALETSLRKIHTFRPSIEIDCFCSLAVSSCGSYLVAGSRSGKIVVWSVKKNSGSQGFTYKQLDVLTQHRGAVLAISFSRDDLTFYSSSADRTVKIWSLESGEALYIDTLYGHQDTVSSLAALGRDFCVTVGSRDRTARLWKVTEETQLVFRGPEASGGSQDVISMIESGAFVTGTDLGAISLWNTRKKKPLNTVQAAHEGNRPIGALSCYPYTDLLASGSADGYLRIWRAAPSSNELTCIRSIPLPGFINSLAWSEDGKVLAVAVGKEPRLGRWETEKSAKNQLHIFNFQ